MDLPTLDEITEFAAAAFRNLLPDKSLARFGDNYRRVRHLALVAADQLATVQQAHRAAMIPTARGADLREHAATWGVAPKGATSASGAAVARLRGTVAAAYTTGLVATSVGGLSYTITSVSGTIPGAGFVDVDIAAVETGTQTNLQRGTVLTLAAPPTGIEAELELQADLSNATDSESDGALVRRVLERAAHPATGGADQDWRAWALAVTGVAEAYVYRHRAGYGTVDVAAFKLGAGAGRALTGGERSTLLAALQAKAPGAPSLVRVLETVADPQPIALRITPGRRPDLARDWNDATPPVVSSWTSGTRTLTFTAARPADMRAGDRLCWEAAGGELSVIESLSGTDAVVLTAAPSVAPSAATLVYSGGPLTELVQRAVRRQIDGWLEGDSDPEPGTYHDSVGPAVGQFGVGWDGGIRAARIQASVMEGVAGLIDCEVTSPGAGYATPDLGYPDDGQVPFLTASYVFVRYA